MKEKTILKHKIKIIILKHEKENNFKAKEKE